MNKIELTIYQHPNPRRKDSFWFDGHVATVTKGRTSVHIIAEGEIRIAFNVDEDMYRNDSAREEAKARKYTDVKLKNISKHDGWGNNNWFAFEIEKGGEKVFYDTATDTNFDDAIITAKRILEENL